MFNSLLSRNGSQKRLSHAEGDIYKVLDIHGQIFEIRYGYYEDYERDNPFAEPIPIYPDFVSEPKYTKEGLPFVTKMQDACCNYKGRSETEADCAECEYYKHCDELIGICLCTHNQNLSQSIDNGVEQEEQK